jgi:small-conductance mechanosensitive channel
MRFPAKKILCVVLPIALLLIASHVWALEEPPDNPTSSTKQELSETIPELAEIIPLSTALSSRLVALENKIRGGLDVSAVEREYTRIEADLKDPADQLQRLKDSKDYRFNMLVILREKIEQENTRFKEASRPLKESIRQLWTWRKDWRAEKKRWDEWQAFILKEEGFDKLKPTFAKANDTINTALNLILPKLEEMLSVQESGGAIQDKINALSAELEGFLLVGRRSVLLEASPPMVSSRYFSQFGGALWYEVQKGLDEISWPDKSVFDRLGWVVLLQVFLSLVGIIVAYRNRQVLKDSKRWRFLGLRPFSAGLFLGTIATVPFFQYEGIPDTWRFLNTIVGGISFVRLVEVLVETSWKRKFIFGVVIVLILTLLIYVINLPLPLFRLYTVLIALVGLFFCWRWAKESVDSVLYTWLLRLGSFLFVIIIIAELWGKEGLAEYLLISSIRSIATVLGFGLFSYLIRGGLEWVFHTSLLQRAKVLYSDTAIIIHRVSLIIDTVIWGLVVLPAILALWGLYPNLAVATKGVLTFGFNLGAQRISVALVIAATGIFYGSYLISWMLQKILIDEVLVRSRVEWGVRVSIGRLLHYVLIFVGFLLALLTLGFKFTELTILLSALGVGIGFGLQSIVNNFISGLILLFERPVRVGDIIELGGNWSEIKRIGLRSTTVQTFDQADVIVPNADLVTNQVTNWTLSNRQARLIIPVGVAYGSDVPLVMETLTTCARENSKVAQTPPPQVLFLGFGESSLDFELRVWVLDVGDRLTVKSELHQEVDRSFREAKIVIAFPQRDVHLDGTNSVEIKVLSEDLATTKK